LGFIPEAERAVREMRRVTHPGGIVAASMWDTRGGLTIGRMFWDTAAMLDPSAVERRSKVYTRPMARPGDLARAWQAAGFHDVVDGMITIRMDFACFEDFWNPMQGTEGPYAENDRTLTIERKNKSRDADIWVYIVGDPDGARSYTATAWAVKGRVPEH